MIYAETEIKLKNGCTAVVRNARPENAKQMIEYLRTVSGESPFLLREPDEVNFTVENERAILQNKAESPNEIMLTAYVMSTEQLPHFGGARKSSAEMQAGAKGYTESCGDSAPVSTWQSHGQRFPAVLR